MSPPHEPLDLHDPAGSDPRLIDYLLGLLPDEEAEPLDEASVADEQFAWRIRVSENELVDAYVSGTLPPETRQQFERAYLISPRRREKVRIAEELLAATSRAPAAEDTGATFARVAVARFGAGAGGGARTRTEAGARADAANADAADQAAYPRPFDAAGSGEGLSKRAPSGGASLESTPITPVSSPPTLSAPHGQRASARHLSANAVSWGCVAAAALLPVMAGVMVFQQVWLRETMGVVQADHLSFAHRTQELERQLVDQRAAQAETSRELAVVRAQLAEAAKQAAARRAASASGSASRAIATSILLRPQTRAAADVPILAVRREAEGVPVTLLLDAQWFVRYRAALKDPATGTIIWRSRTLTPESIANSPVIALVIPSRVLRAQHYSLDLSGLGAAGAESVGSYTFRIVRP